MHEAIRGLVGACLSRLPEWARMRVAKWADRNPANCWADWCGWAMGYSEFPARDTGIDCQKLEPGPGSSCWCGKFILDREAAERAMRGQT